MRSLVISLLVVSAFAGGLLAGRTSAAVTAELQPQWTVAGELSRPRAYARAVALATGEVLIVGGLDPEDEHVTIPTSELFDPATGRVIVLPDQVNGRVNHALTTGWGDRVVMTGGQEWLAGGWRSVSRTDVYLPYSRTWLRGSNMRQPRNDHGAAALLDGRVLVTGGDHNGRLLKSTEIYDPETDIWDVGRPLPRERTQFSAATLPDGRVLVAGGWEVDGQLTRSTWLYDPEGDTWDRGPLMREVRLNHSMVRLPSGDILFFGGEAAGAGTAELYDWRNRRFEHAGVLGEPRLVAQGVLLPDGKVLAVGGLPQLNDRKRFLPTIDAELWDPVKSVWLDLIDPPTSRAWAQVVATQLGVYRLSGVGDDEVPMRTIEALTWH
jgi:hypothetical protein